MEHDGWLRNRWLPLISWGIAAAVVLLVAVPSWLSAMNEAGERELLMADLVSTKRNQSLIERLEKSDPERALQLRQLQSRCHLIENDEEIRGRWLETIRRHDAKIRQLEVNEPHRRPWGGVEDDVHGDRFSVRYGAEADFVLHQQSIQLRIEAPLTSVRQIVDELLADDPIAEIVSLAINPLKDDAGVELRLEMLLFGLSDGETNDAPSIAANSGSRGARESS